MADRDLSRYRIMASYVLKRNKTHIVNCSAIPFSTEIRIENIAQGNNKCYWLNVSHTENNAKA